MPRKKTPPPPPPTGLPEGARPHDIYDFFLHIMQGDPVQAGHGKEADSAEITYPTLDQRVKAATTLLGLFDSMTKQSDKKDQNASLCPATVNAMRESLLRKLARLAATEHKRKIHQQPE